MSQEHGLHAPKGVDPYMWLPVTHCIVLSLKLYHNQITYSNTEKMNIDLFLRCYSLSLTA